MQPVALALGLDDPAPVGEPVESGAGEALLSGAEACDRFDRRLRRGPSVLRRSNRVSFCRVPEPAL